MFANVASPSSPSGNPKCRPLSALELIDSQEKSETTTSFSGESNSTSMDESLYHGAPNTVSLMVPLTTCVDIFWAQKETEH